jgi:hypothetical protein
MKIKIHLFALIVSFFTYLSTWGQSPNFDWAKKFDGWGDVIIQDVEVNSTGRIIALGTFADSVDFDPGPGVMWLRSKYRDMFVMCLTPAGNLSWVKQFTVTVNISDPITPQEMALDTLGNIFVAGSFKGTQDFDPSAGTYTMSAGQLNDGFLIKLNPQGNFLWAKEFDGDVAFKDLELDTFQNIYLSGSFQGATDFDPGIQTAIFQTVNGAYNGFVLKISPGGNYRWTKVLSGSQTGEVNDLKIDNSGGVYYGGFAPSNTDLDPGAPVFTLTTRCAFIGNLDSIGNYLNSAIFDGAGTIYSLLLTPSGIVAAGKYNGQFDLDPGPNQQIVTIANQDCGFILKVDSSFSFIWGRTINSTTTSVIYNVRLTKAPQNDFYLFSDFRGTFDFDPGIGTLYLTSKLSAWQVAGDIAVVRYDSTGYLKSAFSIGPGFYRNVPATYHKSGKIIMGGSFLQTTDFDPSANTFSLIPYPNASKSGFIMRFANCTRQPSINVNSFGTGTVVCVGEEITLFASGADWYSWTPSYSENWAITVTITATSSYSVVGYDVEGCFSSSSITIVADQCVGIEEHAAEALSIYPNPAADALTITCKDYNRLFVYDASGRLLQDYPITAEVTKLNLEGLSNGVYHLELLSPNKPSEYRKILKQNN